MDADQPKPIAEARARIEAERAEAEIWFSEQVKQSNNRDASDGVLLGYVFSVFFAYADEIFDAGLKLRWPAAEVRERIDGALNGVIDEAFSSKHPGRDTAWEPAWHERFQKAASEHIRTSEEWRDLQASLKELAEWEAAGGEHQCCLDRAAYPFNCWLVGNDPEGGFSTPQEEGEFWWKKAWDGFHALLSDAEREMAPAIRDEKLAHAIDGLAYDLAVLKANGILEKGLRGDSAVDTYRDEAAKIIEEIESACRAWFKRMAGSVDDETTALQNLAQPFHRVRDDLLRLFDILPSTGEAKLESSTGSGNRDGNGGDPTEFPKRASWLTIRLRERSWNKHDLSRHGGPDHKTVQKVLDGMSVREDVLQKVADGHSKHKDKVTVIDIPQD
jgi:hypothetical protein